MKVNIKIPNDLSEITLEQYQKYIKIVEQNKNIENIETFLELKMIEIFCYIPYAEAINIKYKDVKSIVGHLTTLLNRKPDLVKGFDILETKFGFVTNLDELSYDEYTTIDTNIGSIETLHIAMAVLYRPIASGSYKSKYLLEDYQIKRYWDVMKHMPLDAAFSAMVFFYRLGIELSKATLKYLQTEEIKMNFQHELNLVQNGVGITQFTDLVEEILQSTEI
jgi:hypothetical protein